MALALTACTAPVRVPEPSPPAEIERTCRALHHGLPDELDGEWRRPTEPESRLLAAWGSPPIALRCGVGRPAALRPTSQLVTVDGVDWLPDPAEAPTRFTTVGRTAYVQVIVSEDSLPPANVLVELADPIKAAVPPEAPAAAGASGGTAHPVAVPAVFDHRPRAPR